MKLTDFIGPATLVVFFGAILAYPVARDKFYPAPATEKTIIEYKDRVVEKEKIVEKKVAPTITVNALKVTLIRVIDADTAVFDVELPLHIKLIDQHIRCTGYDGYELSEVKGLAAKEAFENLLKDAEIFIMVDSKERDNFGRILASIFSRKNDKVIKISDVMIENGFAKESK